MTDKLDAPTPRTDDFPRIGCIQHDCDACATRAQEFAQLTADLAECQTEIERLRADAERYRWIRDVGNSTWQPLRDRYTPNAGSEHNAARAGIIDAAIDAARASVKGE